MILTLFSILFILVALVIVGSSVIFVAAMLLNLIKNQFISLQAKVLWGVAIMFLPLIGAVAYFFTVFNEPRRRARVGLQPPEE